MIISARLLEVTSEKMSAALDSSSKPLSECKKRSSSPRRESELDCPPSKRSKADKEDEEGAVRVSGSSEEAVQKKAVVEATAVGDSSGKPKHKEDSSKAADSASKPDSAAKGSVEEPSSAPREKERSDSAAFAAAEALASLTGGGGGGGSQGRGSSSIDDHDKEVMLPCSSRQAALDDKDRSSRPSCSSSTTTSNFTTNFSSSNTSKDRVRIRGRPAEAAVADSSSSVLGGAERKDPRKGSNQDQKEKNREDEEDDEDEEEEDDDDSLAGSSSSTASSSVASDNEENEEGECAIVAVRMAPEVRQSVSLLAQVQMRLDALEKKGARLHQRLELKLSRQRRPHLDQRGAITQTIPGFWVTALLNHPHLSAHIDENDEDALSYMTNLEIETFKNNKLGYRICFHFRRNPFFQNKVIVKELHLGMGGSPVSFSNPILWHRGQSLIGNGEPRRTAQGVYQSFFHWFSDHSTPGRDEIAQILKDDLYRNPLRYYLTPLWEPRQNGSTPKPPDNSNGDECVIISDSDDDQEVVSQDKQQEREEEEEDAGPDDSDQEAGESSFEEREEEDLDVEEVGDSRDSGGCEARPQGEEEEDQIDVNEDEEEEAAEQS